MIVIENQSLLDVAVQEEGSAFAAVDLAVKNGLSITDDISPGQKLLLPESIYRNGDIATFFRNRRQLVATSTNIDIEFEDYSLPGEFPLSF